MVEVECRKADVRDILEKTFPNYKGRTYSVRFQDKIGFNNTYWDGGSRNYYAFLRTDGSVRHVPTQSPWNTKLEGLHVDLPLDVMVVEHCFFCGKDLGIRIYLHTSHAPKWLKG